MKKITLIAALLGSVYFSNAQVGIGTPTPDASAMLDITSDDNTKGVLIPRVPLLGTKSPLAGSTTHPESLLVYNTATANSGDLAVTPGFYYWVAETTSPAVDAHWERVVSQTQLTNLTTAQADITKIKALLNAAYGSNNLGDTASSGAFGGMVFTPAIPANGNDAAVAAKIEYVKWNSTLNGTGGYEKIDITAVISSLINASESKTTVVTYENKQYYLSEAYIQAGGALDASTWTSVPPGALLIDVVGGVANNFLELSTTTTNITKPSGGFYTVKEYIEMLANTPLSGDTKITLTGTGTTADPYVAKLQRWDATLPTPAWVDVDDSAFSRIVKFNETKTEVKTLDGRTFYFSENFTGDSATITTATAAAAATGVFELHMGNTGYTTVEIPAAQNPGGLLIPAKTIYYIDSSGVKIAIPMNDIVYQGISQFTVDQINNTKNKLGDNLSTTSFTGDTITIGGATHYVYRGIYTTTVTANTANTSGVTLGQSGSKILSIDLRYDEGMVASVTDVTLSGTALGFKIGTGKMYHVLGTDAIAADVVVEFASLTAPAGITPAPAPQP